jgi:hypothetical protein
MGTPRGTCQFVIALARGKKLLLYPQEGSSDIVMQIRADVPTEEDMRATSFKVAAQQDERAADLAARELLRFSRSQRRIS